jgi:predicted acyltransferase
MQSAITRLTSLDVFRGITVAAMILVNNPGSWAHVYPPLLHAPWHGCTPTDLIFPFFLFSVGMSIHFSFSKKQPGLTSTLLSKIAKRALIIFLLGLFINLFPKFNFETVRIPGVLQRISLVFFVCAIIYQAVGWRAQAIVFAALLLAYWVLLTVVPVPGIGAANLQPETNLGAWLDRQLLHGHLWVQSKTWDPEGILSTLPAIATGISGMLAAKWISHFMSTQKKFWLLPVAGLVCMAIGWCWGWVFPINKSLWTSSYVLYTSGWAMVFFSFLFWLITVQKIEAWSRPFTWYGVNALFVFVASGLLVKILLRIKVDGISTWSWLHKTFFESWLSPVNASLAFALFWVTFFGIVLYVLYRKNIILKV